MGSDTLLQRAWWASSGAHRSFNFVISKIIITANAIDNPKPVVYTHTHTAGLKPMILMTLIVTVEFKDETGGYKVCPTGGMMDS